MLLIWQGLLPQLRMRLCSDVMQMWRETAVCAIALREKLHERLTQKQLEARTVLFTRWRAKAAGESSSLEKLLVQLAEKRLEVSRVSFQRWRAIVKGANFSRTALKIQLARRQLGVRRFWIQRWRVHAMTINRNHAIVQLASQRHKRHALTKLLKKVEAQIEMQDMIRNFSQKARKHLCAGLLSSVQMKLAFLQKALWLRRGRSACRAALSLLHLYRLWSNCLHSQLSAHAGDHVDILCLIHSAFNFLAELRLAHLRELACLHSRLLLCFGRWQRNAHLQRSFKDFFAQTNWSGRTAASRVGSSVFMTAQATAATGCSSLTETDTCTSSYESKVNRLSLEVKPSVDVNHAPFSVVNFPVLPMLSSGL